MPRYGRVVVKLSGEALAGSSGSGVDPASLAQVAGEVLAVHDLGVQVAVVIGGGNYFRGRMAEGWGISRAEADNIGMLGTVMNALMLRGALTARTDNDVRVMTAMPIHSVAEPFIRLRAVRHLEHGLIVLLAGGIGQPYVTTDYPAVQRALELDADALLVRSNPGSVGDGFRMGREAGAAASRCLGGFYGHLVPSPLAQLRPEHFLPLTQYWSNHAVLVNLLGRRFTDESLGDEVSNQALLRRPGARGSLAYRGVPDVRCANSP